MTALPQPCNPSYSDDDQTVAPSYMQEAIAANSGGFCQWAINGHGFIPTGPTIKELAAGVYTAEWVRDTYTLVPQKLSTDNLVRLPDSKSDQVIAEIEKFWKLKGTYKELGLTHKRGFLLHGPPGSGKTSTVSIVIADTVKRGGVVFLIGRDEPKHWARMLLKFRQIHPDREALIVIEDIDALVKEHSEAMVLSILDGEDTISNAVYIATTNYPKELDARITDRPSRFDWVMEIGLPSAEARRVYLEARVPGRIDMEEWVEATEGLSIAHIKELIVRVFAYGRSFEEEVCTLKGMKYTKNSRPMGFGAQA